LKIFSRILKFQAPKRLFKFSLSSFQPSRSVGIKAPIYTPTFAKPQSLTSLNQKAQVSLFFQRNFSSQHDDQHKHEEHGKNEKHDEHGKNEKHDEHGSSANGHHNEQEEQEEEQEEAYVGQFYPKFEREPIQEYLLWGTIGAIIIGTYFYLAWFDPSKYPPYKNLEEKYEMEKKLREESYAYALSADVLTGKRPPRYVQPRLKKDEGKENEE